MNYCLPNGLNISKSTVRVKSISLKLSILVTCLCYETVAMDLKV